MPIKYDYNPNLNIINSYPYGEISAEEVKTLFVEMISCDNIKTGFIYIVHFKNVENYLYDSDEAQSLVNSYAKLKEHKKPRALIFIGDNTLQFGMSRMLETLHGLYDDEDVVFSVRNEEEAQKIIKKIMS